MKNTMTANYEHAQHLMKGIHTDEVVRNDTVFPHWILDKDGKESNYFWYQKKIGREGSEYHLVDIKNKSNSIAFNHKVLASFASADISSRKKGSTADLNVPTRNMC